MKSSMEQDLSYLGIHLRMEADTVTVSMIAYLEGILKELEVKGTVTTPVTANLFVVNKASRVLDECQGSEAIPHDRGEAPLPVQACESGYLTHCGIFEHSSQVSH